MPGDSVNQVYPSNQVRPVTPHPANIREERRRKQKRHKRQKDKRQQRDDRDRVSLEQKKPAKPDPARDRKPSESLPGDSQKKITIDITV